MYKYRLYFILGSMALLQSKSYGINVNKVTFSL